MLSGILSRRNTASHRCLTKPRALPLGPPQMLAEFHFLLSKNLEILPITPAKSAVNDFFADASQLFVSQKVSSKFPVKQKTGDIPNTDIPCKKFIS